MKIVVKLGGATLEDCRAAATRGAGRETTGRGAPGRRGPRRRRCSYTHAGTDGQAERVH